MLDKYFAIQRVGDDKYEMGTKVVAIDENSDIIEDGVKYDCTYGTMGTGYDERSTGIELYHK